MFLDPKGLVALWREALLARAVLEGKTQGYKNHPQLVRFRAQKKPILVISEYLRFVYSESQERGYNFDANKLALAAPIEPIAETQGQLEYEWQHLGKKLQTRNSELHERFLQLKPKPHPLFEIVPGGVRGWENVA